MPTLTRWFIKTAFLYLAAALLLALLLAARPIWSLPAWFALLNPAYFHLFLVGWVSQMIFGVIYWMFPIVTRAQPRGPLWLGWAGYGALNGGLLLRVIAEPLAAGRPGSVYGWWLVAAAVLQWLAAMGLIVLSWPRVRERYRGE